MAIFVRELSADISPLKRPFDQFAADFAGVDDYCHDGFGTVIVVPGRSKPFGRYDTERRTLPNPLNYSMLSQTTPIMSSSFPSFMSVYGSEESKGYNDGLSVKPENNTIDQNEYIQFPSSTDTSSYTTHPLPRSIRRRGSSNSVISYSTGSSPTTTSSTFDSPLITDMPCSPSSSPESASSAIPPKSFKSSLRQPGMDPKASFPLYQPPTLQQPAEETKRNVKNLTLDMKLPALVRPATSAGVESSLHPFSAPSSPLKEPLKTGRRKPTNLTIRTPGFNQLTFSRPGEVPPTPNQRSLFVPQPLSSPSLPTLVSPTHAPAGGMQLAFPNIAQHIGQGSSLNTACSSTIVEENHANLREDDYDPPRSQEAPERGYTSGPVRIYDSGIWLYLEPTAEEASKFDIVINCAKEIKDPFEKEGNSETVMSVWRNHAGTRESMSEPQTAMSEISFRSAFEWPPANSPSTPTPSTPKPHPTASLKRPEYLHVPWDHNSEILEDLYPLCEIIDDRVRKGRKVLIHCQLGVSRSASLIIAYGLFKGYESNFHSMYMAVKERSRWVGPNMSLIYQLTDFRSKCASGEYKKKAKMAEPSWFVHCPDNAKTPTPAVSGVINDKALQPQTIAPSLPAPSLPGKPPLQLNKELPPVPLPSPLKEELVVSSSIRKLPDTASTHNDIKPSLACTSEAFQTVRHAIWKSKTTQARNLMNSQLFIPPHQPKLLQGLIIKQPSSLMDLARQDVPASPSIFSPRATEFVASPFGIRGAGDLVTSAPKRMRPPPGAFPGGNEWRQSLRQSMDLSQDIAKLLSQDPRSPHQPAESKEIIRNIDDVL